MFPGFFYVPGVLRVRGVNSTELNSQVILSLERLATEPACILSLRAVCQLVLRECARIIEQLVADRTLYARM